MPLEPPKQIIVFCLNCLTSGIPRLPPDYECGNCGSKNLRVYQEIYTQREDRDL
jgi:hypothetical protein